VIRLSYLVSKLEKDFLPDILSTPTGQDPATGVSGELSFAVGLKNLILDTTNISGGKSTRLLMSDSRSV
jgi:hypothetical protein